MTYEETLAELFEHGELLACIESHCAKPSAKLAAGMAIQELEAIIRAARRARKMLRKENGYEHYSLERKEQMK